VLFWQVWALFLPFQISRGNGMFAAVYFGSVYLHLALHCALTSPERPAFHQSKRFNYAATWCSCSALPKTEDRVLYIQLSRVQGYLSAPASRNALAETAKTE
jgi:hypothetical protein